MLEKVVLRGKITACKLKIKNIQQDINKLNEGIQSGEELISELNGHCRTLEEVNSNLGALASSAKDQGNSLRSVSRILARLQDNISGRTYREAESELRSNVKLAEKQMDEYYDKLQKLRVELEREKSNLRLMNEQMEEAENEKE